MTSEQVSDQKTYHVIPHSHWDREWYLSYDHFRVRLVHMIDDLLEILARDPEYRGFTLDGQTVILEDYLEIRPERESELRQHVADGRLSIGPWYILPDEFLVSGESTVRNLMRGRADARRFGAGMDVGYIPDSFGHIAQMPQILQGFDIDSAIVWRGFGGEPGEEPSEYRWVSPDGSAVLMEHLSNVGYSGGYFHTTDPDKADEIFSEMRRRLDYRAQTSERLILSGGDHFWPDEYLPATLDQLNARYEQEGLKLKQSSIPEFMESMANSLNGAELSEVHGEMRFGYRWAFNVTGGVYSTRMYLKQANANSQWLLERYLEPLNIIGIQEGLESQSALIQQGWKYLLKNHPHDSICGCSIDPVHREMTTRFEKIRELGKGVERFFWMGMAAEEEGDPDDDHRLTFFNPSPYRRTEVVECSVDFFRQDVVVGLNPDVEIEPPLPDVKGFELKDQEGATVPYEILDHTYDYGIAMNRYDYPSQSRVERFHIRLPLEELPPLGFKNLEVRRTDSFPDTEMAKEFSWSEGIIENPYVRVEIDDSGRFYVTDKETEMKYGPLAHLEDSGDAGDEYNYSPPDQDDIHLSGDEAEVETETISGSFQLTLKVRGTWELPTGLSDDMESRSGDREPLPFEITASITPYHKHVNFHVTLTNRHKDHRLRALFETGCKTNVHRADSQFSVLERERESYDPEEFDIEVPTGVAPMQRFVTVEDEDRAAGLIAVGLPEYELKYDSDGTLALTLLRCVGELARGDLKMRPGGRAGWKNATPDAQCQGEHSFRFAFLPQISGWPASMDSLNRAAESVHLPVKWDSGPGAPLSLPESLLEIAPASLTLSALKEAEDGEGLIVRIYNPTPETIEGEVTFGTAPDRILETNLEERNLHEISFQGSTLQSDWDPCSIRTFRVLSRLNS